jgi:photosystem II stability/assembly factor-like uncharacterized protein
VRRAALLCAAAVLAALVLPRARAQERAGSVVTSLTIFTGTASGLWKSGDWGGHWERVRGRADSASLADVGAARSILALGPGVLVGTDAGLFVSQDFGQAWKRTELRRPVHAVLPSRYPQSDPTVFAGTADGLLRSVDAGATFTPTIVRGMRVSRLEWPGPDLVLATDTGVLVSEDGGKSFRSGRGLPDGQVNALALSSFYGVDPVVFAGTPTGVFRSGDGARTWSPAGLDGQAVHDVVWLGPFLYAATDQALYQSVSGGRSWSRLGEGIGERRPRRLLFPLAPDSGAEAFLGTDRGILHTSDGGSHWNATGSLDEEVLALATFPTLPRPSKIKKK